MVAASLATSAGAEVRPHAVMSSSRSVRARAPPWWSRPRGNRLGPLMSFRFSSATRVTFPAGAIRVLREIALVGEGRGMPSSSTLRSQPRRPASKIRNARFADSMERLGRVETSPSIVPSRR